MGHAGNSNAARHGAGSEVLVRRVATTQKRRILRQIGLRANELDGIGLGLLDNWARAQSKVELYDTWASEHGFLSPDGKSPPWIKEYFAALNSARLSLRALQEHLRTRKPARDELGDYLADHYDSG